MCAINDVSFIFYLIFNPKVTSEETGEHEYVLLDKESLDLKVIAMLEPIQMQDKPLSTVETRVLIKVL